MSEAASAGPGGLEGETVVAGTGQHTIGNIVERMRKLTEEQITEIDRIFANDISWLHHMVQTNTKLLLERREEESVPAGNISKKKRPSDEAEKEAREPRKVSKSPPEAADEEPSSSEQQPQSKQQQSGSFTDQQQPQDALEEQLMSELSYKELQVRLKAENISAYGKKAVLAKRLAERMREKTTALTAQGGKGISGEHFPSSSAAGPAPLGEVSLPSGEEEALLDLAAERERLRLEEIAVRELREKRMKEEARLAAEREELERRRAQEQKQEEEQRLLKQAAKEAQERRAQEEQILAEQERLREIQEAKRLAEEAAEAVRLKRLAAEEEENRIRRQQKEKEEEALRIQREMEEKVRQAELERKARIALEEQRAADEKRRLETEQALAKEMRMKVAAARQIFEKQHQKQRPNENHNSINLEHLEDPITPTPFWGKKELPYHEQQHHHHQLSPVAPLSVLDPLPSGGKTGSSSSDFTSGSHSGHNGSGHLFSSSLNPGAGGGASSMKTKILGSSAVRVLPPLPAPSSSSSASFTNMQSSGTMTYSGLTHPPTTSSLPHQQTQGSFKLQPPRVGSIGKLLEQKDPIASLLSPESATTLGGKKGLEEEGYVISDHEGDDNENEEDEEDEGEDDEHQKGPGKTVPAWARNPSLREALEKQYKEGHLMDPDKIFPEIHACDLEEIFKDARRREKKPYRARSSSAMWHKDGLTAKEVMDYRKAMGFT